MIPSVPLETLSGVFESLSKEPRCAVGALHDRDFDRPNVAQSAPLRPSAAYAGLERGAHALLARKILEASPNIVYVYSVPEQRCLYVSPQVGTILGYSPDEVVTMGAAWLTSLPHPDDTERLAQTLSLIGTAADREVVTADYRVRHRDGMWRYVTCRNVAFGRSPDGRVDRFLGTLADVTAQTEGERALRESEQRYRTVVENQSELICHYLPDTTLTFVNEAYCNYFGRTREALIGSRFLDLVPADARTTALGCIESLLSNAGSAVVVEHQVMTSDGRVRWQEWVDRALVDADGRVTELQGIGRDVTDRRAAEEALRASLEEVRRLRDRLQSENTHLQEQLADVAGVVGGRCELVYCSEQMQLVVHQIERAAPTDATVLITGETGTGKEVFASTIHHMSPRRDRPFVRVNCGALPPHLVESELFGHERGAFTGATARRIGRFEAADGGTLLLDEIGELPRELQPKLLRVLQEGEFERLGSSRSVKVNVRVIAATNRDLLACVNSGTFRADLYYRLNVLPIVAPPLRERAEDIPLLATTFLAAVARRLERTFEPFDPKTISLLQRHSWPGNVRELRNVVERAALNASGRVPVVVPGWLEYPATAKLGELSSSVRPNQPVPVDGCSTEAKDLSLDQIERNHITAVLTRTRWRVEGAHGAAAILGMRPSTLRSRIKRLGIK